jgi:O-acetyl-ADP-ribose deacetylase (regulator of RNase III)/glutathione synthase/RimK-type ligase-like ATP-grasp enzyme
MDMHARQHDAANRKDHPAELIERNAAAAFSEIVPLTQLDSRIDGNVRRGNIVDLDVQAIVNAANETLLGGGGVDEAIHAAAGPELRAACAALPSVPGKPAEMRCATGEARVTPGFRLRAKFVIHTVAPYLDQQGQTQPELLRRCYRSCMEAALKKRMTSIAFCCLGTGFYGYPMLDAAKVAIPTVSAFLREHLEWDVRVIFSVFNEVEERVYRGLMRGGLSFLPLASLNRGRLRPRLADDETATVMVVDQNASNDWYTAFRGVQMQGRPVRVEQTSWQAILSCVARHDRGVQFDVEATPNAKYGTSMGSARSFSPHVVLVRNFAKGAKDDDYKHFLFALQHCGVPCVNSVESLLLFTDRANAIAAGHRVQAQLPLDFQMVPIHFYTNVRELYFGDEVPMPVVCKVGSCHSGYGKMRFDNRNALQDFHGIVSLGHEFITTEPFLDKDFEYRLQSMGGVLRAYSRASLTHDWKANQGEGKVVDLPLTERHQRIAAAVNSLFPQFDIWGIDLLVTRDGQEYCLEINDSSIGFNENHQDEDMRGIVACVMRRLQEFYK